MKQSCKARAWFLATVICTILLSPIASFGKASIANYHAYKALHSNESVIFFEQNEGYSTSKSSANIEHSQESLSAHEKKPNDSLDESDDTKKTKSPSAKPQQKKDAVKEYTIMVYIAADNDLHYFAWNNIKQLAQGANKNISIVVQLNEPGRHRKTQCYLIEKGKATLLNKDQNLKLDSGDHQTLIDFCTNTIKTFPAKEYVLILWNHGTGVIDPIKGKTISPADLFVLNPSNMMLEIDRSISFLDLIAPLDTETRGICFDDTFQTYLTNQKLEIALKEVTEKALHGNKFAILGLDACLMAMLEVGNIVKNYAHILVASQELELGAGWRYDKMLQFFNQQSLAPRDFARQMVTAYQEAYAPITPDYTLSAMNLDTIGILEKAIDSLALLLLKSVQQQRGNQIKSIIKKCKSGISFDEPSYIDFAAFCTKLMQQVDNFEFADDQYNYLKKDIKTAATNCLANIRTTVFANTHGSNLAYASGISVYFPERGIHTSYRKTEFARSNNWYTFIGAYISL